MVGFPYYTDVSDDVNDETYLSDVVVGYSKPILISAIITLVCNSPAFAVDSALGKNGTAMASALAGNEAKKKSIGAVAILAPMDVVACGKAGSCVNAVTEAAKDNVVKHPKITTAVVCTAAIVWCARGIAERVINSHL